MDTTGYTETEKIKILYEESLKDIRNLTTRLEEVSSKVQSTSVTVHEVEKLANSAISEAFETFHGLADKEMKRAGLEAMGAMSSQIGIISQRVAGDSAASERQKSFAWAAGSMTIFGAFMYAAGLALGSKALDGVGWGYLTMLPLIVGIAGGMALCMALFYGDRIKLKEGNYVQNQDATTAPGWTELEVNLVSKRAHMSDRTAKACWDVLSGNSTIDDAASEFKIVNSEIKRSLKILEEKR